MARRSLEDRNIRTLSKVGQKSYAVTIPIEVIRELGWQEKQKVVVTKRGSKVVIADWEG